MELAFTFLLILTGLTLLYSIRETQNRKLAEKGRVAYYGSRKWKRVAKASKQRDGNRCRVCNSPSQLQSHHPDYSRLYHERPQDLTTLCADCHLVVTLMLRARRQGKPFPPPTAGDDQLATLDNQTAA